jgi:hypothetical protein
LTVNLRQNKKALRPGDNIVTVLDGYQLDIKRDQVRSRREQWTTDALGRLARGHSSTVGKDFDCPIIIAEYDGIQYVLDGNHRINRWVTAGDPRVHDVNIHTITGFGKFIELPAVTET